MAGRLVQPGNSTPMQQLVRSDRSMVMASDDNVMLRQIQATHSPDGRQIDVKQTLKNIEHILIRSTQDTDATIPGIDEPAMIMEDDAQIEAFATSDARAKMIDRISNEIAHKYSVGEDGHQTTVSLLNILSNYSWDAKLVLTLAAFASDHYGEFRLLTENHPSNQLAKSLAILKRLPTKSEHSGSSKRKLEALTTIVTAMFDVTRCIVEFKELPSAYVSQDVPAWTAAWNIIPIAVYWTIRGVVVCAPQIRSLTTAMGLENGTASMEEWELSSLAHRIKNIHDHLMKQWNICNQLKEEKKTNESYEKLQRIFEVIHIDNMKVLNALLRDGLKALLTGRESRGDDQPPLFDGSSKKRVHLETLRWKNVLLLISSLDISQEELSILEQIYNESRQHATQMDRAYEMVWVPIVDRSVDPWTEDKQTKFESLQSTMTWFTVHHPTQIDQAVIRFVKEKWHFRNKPILVVLDPQGRVVSPNAIHMMWIWGTTAFPFTSQREEALWRGETWRLELLVNGIDQTVLNWIREEKYIFVYGGDDIEWIRRFTREARAVAMSARIPLEMVYVGKSHKKERVRKIIATITDEKLSYAWQDVHIWFFWTRLESMLHSKIQLGQADDIDPVMREIKKLLSSDKSGPWAVLCRGSAVVVNGHGSKVMPTLLEYDLWKEHVGAKGFDRAFKDYHDVLHASEHPCCRFEFHSTAGTGRIPGSMKCPECFRVMEKYTTFCCCHDHEIPSEALN